MKQKFNEKHLVFIFCTLRTYVYAFIKFQLQSYSHRQTYPSLQIFFRDFCFCSKHASDGFITVWSLMECATTIEMRNHDRNAQPRSKCATTIEMRNHDRNTQPRSKCATTIEMRNHDWRKNSLMKETILLFSILCHISFVSG